MSHLQEGCSSSARNLKMEHVKMTARPNPFADYNLVSPLVDFGNAAQDGLDPTIAELIKIRASQLNGCAACLHMHTADARKNGETEERIFLLDAWRESPLFSEAERAVLAWTEALTRLAVGGVRDQAFEALKAHFTEREQIKITLLIGAINAFNRVNVGFGVRHPGRAPRQAA